MNQHDTERKEDRANRREDQADRKVVFDRQAIDSFLLKVTGTAIGILSLILISLIGWNLLKTDDLNAHLAQHDIILTNLQQDDAQIKSEVATIYFSRRWDTSTTTANYQANINQ